MMRTILIALLLMAVTAQAGYDDYRACGIGARKSDLTVAKARLLVAKIIATMHDHPDRWEVKPGMMANSDAFADWTIANAREIQNIAHPEVKGAYLGLRTAQLLPKLLRVSYMRLRQAVRDGTVSKADLLAAKNALETQVADWGDAIGVPSLTIRFGASHEALLADMGWRWVED